MIDFLILLFTYLPSALIHSLVIISVCGYFVSTLIPTSLLSYQKDIVKYGSIALFFLWIFLEGGLSVSEDYIAAEKDWGQKIAVAEETMKATNAKIDYVFIDRVQKVKDVQVVVKERIRDIAVQVDKDCHITSEIVEILNEAARNGEESK